MILLSSPVARVRPFSPTFRCSTQVLENRAAKDRVMPITGGQPLVAPTALSCLQCQVLGRRNLLCSRVQECKAVPHVFALGPVLLLGWIATMVAFFFAIR